MLLIELLYWIAIGIVVYTYAIYPCLLWVFNCFAGQRKQLSESVNQPLPEITLLIAAYNEADCLEEKILNALALDYPRELLHIWVVTDGSTDTSPLMVTKFSGVQLYHEPERRGKIVAIQRVMQYVETELVVFSDANALLNKGCLRAMAAAFSDASVGAVAGEKRVVDGEDALTGESMYWIYESKIKKWEGGLYSVTGPAGEIFAIRTNLYREVPPNTLSDDLAISWQIISQGYRMAYAADAISLEQGLPDFRQSFARRIRVAAGSVQAAVTIFLGKGYNWKLVFWWEVISHRILRTLVVPYLIPIISCLNVVLINEGGIFTLLFAIQLYGYLATGVFWIRATSAKSPFWISLPAFFILVHATMIVGAWSLWKGKQTVLWETYPRSATKGFWVGKND
jgi:poly-beta-1,6-N-acetyl-D-glucosamine synthase